MNNGIKGKEPEDKFFTIEFFGVTIIITTLLLLLCLFFGEVILFEVGKEIQNFIYGVLGYFAFPFLITLFFVGFMVLLGKKPNFKKRGGSLIYLGYLVTIAFSILTILNNLSNPQDLNEYVNYAFESGKLGLEGVVPGGALFSLICYAPVKYLGSIFSVIILSVVTIFVIYFRLRYKFKHRNDAKPEETEKPAVSEPQFTQQPVVEPQVQNPYQQQGVPMGAGQPYGYPQNNMGYYGQGGYQQPTGYQPQDSNVYGAPVSNNGANIFGGQPLNYGQNGYQQGVGYSQNPNPYNQGQPNISKEDAMRILYGNGTAPKTYSNEFQDGFSGMGYRPTDTSYNPQGYSANGGNVSQNIPKHDMFSSYTYEDRSKEFEEEIDNNSQTSYQNPYEQDEDTLKAKNFFNKIKEKYSQENQGDNASYDDYSKQEQEYVEENDYSDEFSSNNYSYDYSDEQGENNEYEEDYSTQTQSFTEPTYDDEPTFDEVEPSYNEPETIEDPQQSPLSSFEGNEYSKCLIENMPINYKYTVPPTSLLKTIDNSDSDYAFELFKSDVKNKILNTLSTFGVETEIANVHRGPAVTRFDIVVPIGVSMSKVVKLQDDLNLRIAAKSAIRMIAPVPNTSYVGIEVPNQVQEMVNLKDLVMGEGFNVSKPSALNFALGKDVIGKPVYLDIAEMPHVLITGTTGSGKSVCLNTMILSLLYKYSPQELRFVIVDPKRVDLEPFKTIPHMMFGEIIEDVPTTNAMLTWAVEEMENRYKVLVKSHAKNLKDYNLKAKANGEKIMPRLVIIIDEFADVMLQDKKGVGVKICLLAQKARAAGIHLVLAAQRPSADIVEGPIKSNLPSRIVFRAASSIDSQVSLGEPGAEKLLGKGDCLYRTGGMFAVERVMGAYVSDEEMYDIIDFVSENNEKYYDYNNWAKIQASVSASQPREESEYNENTAASGDVSGYIDPLNIKAMQIGYDFGGLSASFLQRKLGVGYPRAAKIIDWLTDNGYITPNSIAGKKQMILPREEFEEKFGNNG